jgi:hypothetical protein
MRGRKGGGEEIGRDGFLRISWGVLTCAQGSSLSGFHRRWMKRCYFLQGVSTLADRRTTISYFIVTSSSALVG